ncbi:MAG: M14 family metallopeptidase [Opitutaceae bacterium]
MSDLRVSGLFVVWGAIVLTAAAQEESFAPAVLPPIVPWSGSSEALVVGADHPWVTPSELTDLADSPDYAETLAYLERLCHASDRLELEVFGRTGEGRDLYVVIARSEDQSEDRPIVLAQAGIHSGEIDGKDAGLMLLRDMAVGGKGEILEKVDFLFVPVFNLDGHERRSLYNRPNQRGPIHQGWRTTARNLNLNRDYLKADSPEMRAMLGLIREWEPDLYLDLHVTDGIDYQYDITFGYNGYDGNPAWSPRIGAWLDEILRPEATKALLDGGHIPGRLVFAADDRDPAKGIGLGSTMPRFSDGYGDLRHLPTILVENHSLKPYRQRVLGTYVFLEGVLRCVGENAASLKAAIAADREARVEAAL